MCEFENAKMPAFSNSQSKIFLNELVTKGKEIGFLRILLAVTSYPKIYKKKFLTNV